MLNQLLKFVQWLHFADESFWTGYLAGVLLALVLLVVIKLMWMLLFGDSSRSAGVTIRGEVGNLFISAQAIADLVRVICQDYPRLDLTKVILRDDGKAGLRLELNLNTECHGGSLPELSTEVQRRILAELNERFGIDLVRRVDMRVKNLIATRNRPF